MELEGITGVPMVPQLGGEFVVVQGVADLVVLREAELWLLDFKTDDIAAEDVGDRTDVYRPQVELYAAALAAIYRRPVSRRWLHVVKAGLTVSG